MSETGQAPLTRYLGILEVVAGSHQSVGLSEVAALTGLPKPTVHRMIKTLVAAGALRSHGTQHQTYGLGPRLWRMLYLGLNPDTVANYAQNVCDEVSASLEETSYVVRLGQRYIRAIARSVPDQGHRLHVRPGAELPAHAAASTKAVLAYQEPDVRARYLPDPLPALTAHTTTDRDRLEAELAGVAAQGYAVCDREIDEHVMAYACPVKLTGAGVVYAVGVTGPCGRMQNVPERRVVEVLRHGAERFASMLQTVPV